MFSKFLTLYNLVMEQTDDSSILENKKIAVVPGSFKPPHKGHWEMIMNYIDEVDQVIVLISNISFKAISSRPLSFTNLKDFGKIKSKLDEFRNDENLKDLFLVVDNISENSENMSFEVLKNGLNTILEYDDERLSKIKTSIEKYIKRLENSLFKSIRHTSEGTEITPEISRQIFEIFAKAYNVQDKVDIRISDEASPITATYELIEKKCRNCDILLGVSTKGNDAKRWEDLKEDEENSNNIIAVPFEVSTMLSATELRENISSLKKEWFPDKLSENDFDEIKRILTGENVNEI